MHKKYRSTGKWLIPIGSAMAIAIYPTIIMAAPPSSTPEQSCIIDFEGLQAGEVITELSVGSGISGCSVKGVVAVESRNTSYNPAAIVFDSACPNGCSGVDKDLGAPNASFGGPGVGDGGIDGQPHENAVALGKVAILAENMTDSNDDGLVDDPDDADVPGEYRFDFSGINRKGVTISGITVLDVEFDQGEDPAEVIFIRKGFPSSTLAITDTGDNGVANIIDVGLEGVKQLIVKVKGSSALAAISFGAKQRTCWATFGGFDSAFVGPEGQKIASFGGNVGPPPSGHLNIVRHSDGDHLRVPDVAVVGCERVLEYCPNSGEKSPGQPGANKGFDINVLHFAGTGLLTEYGNTRSVSVSGKLIDCGEPGGKKGRDPDQFHVYIDGELFVGDVLGGGNVQLHPPVPNN